MADRFFTDSAFVDDEITLADDQAHHLINVMRAKLDDEVVLFDSQGNEFRTRIIYVAKKRLTLRRFATTRPERKLATDITIAVSLPKGDRQKFLIEKLVELGVAKLIPLSTPRSVAQVNQKVIGRIEKQIIEATKQCRRSYLMKIAQPKTIAEMIESYDAVRTSCYIAHPYNAQSMADVAGDDSQEVVWLIGPEGGFSEEEVEQATAAGWRAIKFGEIILRIETAAMFAAIKSRST